MEKTISLLISFLLLVLSIYSQENFKIDIEDNQANYSAYQFLETNDYFSLMLLIENFEGCKKYKRFSYNKFGEAVNQIDIEKSENYLKRNNGNIISTSLINVSEDYKSFDLKISELDMNFNLIDNFNFHYEVSNGNFFEVVIQKQLINDEGELLVLVTLFDEMPLTNSINVIFRISEANELISTESYSEENGFYYFDIEQVPVSKGYLITTINSYSFGSEIIKLDSDFNYISTILLDSLTFPIVYYPYGGYIKFYSDTTFLYNVLTRFNDIVNGNKFELMLVDTNLYKIDSVLTGVQNTEHSGAIYNGLDFIYNDAIYFGGSRGRDGSDPSGPYYSIVAKANGNLDIEWEKFIEYENPIYMDVVYATEDGGCVTVVEEEGNTVSLHLIKFDAEGNYPITGIESPKISEMILYPNPATDYINIRYGAHLHDVVFDIYDISGKLILSQNLENPETQIDISSLNSGTYIFKSYNKEREIETGKFVKQ